MKATPKQKQIIAILVKGDKEFKAQLVKQATGDQAKTSTNDLTFKEANAIIETLGGKTVWYENWAIFNKNNQQHKYILSLSHQYGWKNGKYADTVRLSEWLKSSKSPIQKPLLNMHSGEVSKVITALEQMVSKKY